MSLELQDLYSIRSRVLAGEDVPLEEVTKMITFLRADRQAKLTKEKKPSKKAVEVDTDKLLNAVIG